MSSTVASSRPGPTAAHELTSARAVVRFALTRRPMAALATAVVVLVVVRLASGPPTGVDAAVVAVVVALIGPAEWLIHGTFFHAPVSSRRQRWLGTGVDHRRHHDDPADLVWLLLSRSAMVTFAVVLAVVAVAVAALVVTTAGLVSGSTDHAPMITAVALAWTALLHYEFTHLLVHSRCRIRSARYGRLRTNHLAHHHRDEHRRLGVTTTIGDRLFGTGTA